MISKSSVLAIIVTLVSASYLWIHFKLHSNSIEKHPVKDNAQSTVAKICSGFRLVDRFDCHPENGVTQKTCEVRGCCWNPTTERRKAVNAVDNDPVNITNQPWSSGQTHPQAPVDVPWCYYPRDYPGYTVGERKDTDTGFVTNLSRQTTSYYPQDIKDLVLEVQLETDRRLHIKIYDPGSRRFEVPLTVPYAKQKAKDPSYSVSVADAGRPFSFSVKRRESDRVLLNTSGAAAFIYANQFLQLSYFVPSVNVYGLGEHRDTLLHSFNWTRFTMWAKDHPPTEDSNLYGAHPFYLMMEEDGKNHGVFLLNSNAMDVVLQPSPAITWRTIGGVLDLYVFLGPRPDDVIQQFTEVIGRTFMPPYWSLGFHMCRWGYTTVNETLGVVNRLKEAGIPQDVQWNDNDYTQENRVFTTNITQFGDQGEMVKELHQRGMHYVVIVDPGISNTQSPGTYPPYDVGEEMDIFIKDYKGKQIVGEVWPGETVFPDFTNPASHTYWLQMVEAFHKSVAIDGMWIDMNELISFVTGSINGCPKDSLLEDPPYVPAVLGGKLRWYTLCTSALQFWSVNYDVHNLYGLTMSNATYHALRTVRKKRPFVISRSTFSGQGRFGGHWTGDNLSAFYDMYKSISAILSMNMFGIPMVGADICGFQGNTTEELCQRWHQLGAFYPFSRNHNDRYNRDQDPASFGPDLAQSTRQVLLIRYSLLPYLYTLFHKSHTLGQTVARPLFFEYPLDTLTYHIDRQFLWGAALLISPVLTEKTVIVNAYFPNDVWYDFYTGAALESVGRVVTLDAPLNKINLHMRGGFIIPTQDPARTTTESRKQTFGLLVALDIEGHAYGDMYWDDGDSLDTYSLGIFTQMSFSAEKGQLTSEVKQAGYKEEMVLGSVSVFGVQSEPGHVTVNEVKQLFTYDSKTKVLYIQRLKVQLLQKLAIRWW